MLLNSSNHNYAVLTDALLRDKVPVSEKCMFSALDSQGGGRVDGGLQGFTTPVCGQVYFDQGWIVVTEHRLHVRCEPGSLALFGTL